MSRTIGFVIAVSLAASVAAQEAHEVETHNLGPEHLALKGYDPVSYFDEGGAEPQVGDASRTHTHAGAVYRFASEAHRDLFAADPGRYEPAYGGWCAYAMSQDVEYDIDPLAFRIGEGRLLLFADSDYVDVDGKWVGKERELIAHADQHWKARSGEAPRKAPPGSYRPTHEWNLTDASLAMEGFDPVSYFAEGGSRPVQGKPEFRQRRGGVLYLFANEENLETFRKDPERYEPAHGGWCSYAMALKGEKVEVDPQAYRLTNGRLHLFYKSWLADTRKDWDEDAAGLKQRADENWARLLERATAQR